MSIPECGCGSQPYLDWWINVKTKKEEVFVRCPGCECVGEGRSSEEEAIKSWTEFKSL